MVRRLLRVLGSLNLRPPCVCSSDRRTVTVPLPRSMSCQRNARSSPRLIPVASAMDAMGSNLEHGQFRQHGLKLVGGSYVHLVRFDLRGGYSRRNVPPYKFQLHRLFKSAVQYQEDIRGGPTGSRSKHFRKPLLHVHGFQLLKLDRSEARNDRLAYRIGLSLPRNRGPVILSFEPLPQIGLHGQLGGIGQDALVGGVQVSSKRRFGIFAGAGYGTVRTRRLPSAPRSKSNFSRQDDFPRRGMFPLIFISPSLQRRSCEGRDKCLRPKQSRPMSALAQE